MRCLKSGTAQVSCMKPFMCQKIWRQHLAGIVTSVPKVLSKQRPAHPPGSSSESTFERLGLRPWQQPPPPVGSGPMSALSLDWLEGKCSNQERLWHRVQDQDSASVTMSPSWKRAENQCRVIFQSCLHSKWKCDCFIYLSLRKMCDKNCFLGGTRAKCQRLWQQNDLWQLKEFCTTDSKKNKPSLDNSASTSVILW